MTDKRLREAVAQVLPTLSHWPGSPMYGPGWDRDTEPHSEWCPPCVLRTALAATPETPTLDDFCAYECPLTEEAHHEGFADHEFTPEKPDDGRHSLG